jgi:hypothetical protein
MICFVFGFLMGLGLPVTVVVLGWRRIIPHLRENREAGQALVNHVVFPLLGMKVE